MTKIAFKTDFMEGHEGVMLLDGISATQIRFNHKTREIFIVYDEAPRTSKLTEADLRGMTWQAVKAEVLKRDGVWTNADEGRKFLGLKD